MTKDEALRMALEALEQSHPEAYRHVITAIKEALAQPEQEPVAVVGTDIGGSHLMYGDKYLGQMPDKKTAIFFKDVPVGAPLYTTPPQRIWVGLTDEEKSELWEVSRAALPRYATYASLIEAKLKEKNT